MNTAELLKSICAASGVSGCESQARAAVSEYLSQFAEVKTDKLGNLIGEIKGEGRHIVLDAHLDQIGLIVTSIDDKGFLKFDKCGGTDIRILPAHDVIVWGKEPVKGVVCSVPPHLAGEKQGEAAPVNKLAIDIGMSAQRAGKLICAGDRITLRASSFSMPGGRLTSPALDNRAGVAIILRALSLLKDTGHGCRLSVLFSSREEIDAGGAKTAAFAIQPDEAVVFDVSFAESPGVSAEKGGKMGLGPMIGISPVLDCEISNKFMEIAQAEQIPFQKEVMGRSTGTNADKISYSAGGIKTGLISVPIKNMHSSAEMVEIADIENSARLLCEYIKEKGRNKND